MDLWTGPLARASRLSAERAHLWMAGWTTLQVAHASPHRPPAAHKLHRAPPPRAARSKTKISKPCASLRHRTLNHHQIGGSKPPQTDTIPTIFFAQPGTDSKSVTFPKSPVTFAEIRSRVWSPVARTIAA